MNFLGIEYNIENKPLLDDQFIPLYPFNKNFLKTASKPISIAVGRNGGQVAVKETFIHGTEAMKEADCYYVERLVKLMLWTKGGYEVSICGDSAMAAHIAQVYSPAGVRAFDREFMSRVYEKDFKVVDLPLEKRPAPKEISRPMGGNREGCRIGFDAGGSDRKVSAVVDGEVVYSEEVVWFPKINSDPEYHFNGILEALKTAASKMPRVDAIGISSAGIYIDNQTMVASLFNAIGKEDFDKRIKNIYTKTAKMIGDVPVVVANDGDVTALAGAMDLNDVNILGIAMGTSEAAGYVNDQGDITGWLNELAFAPVDAHPEAMADEWSGDIGCGVKYFSQDGVIKLAQKAGIPLDDALSPGEKLKVVQKLIEGDDLRGHQVFQSVGAYLGHTLPLYHDVYGMKHILLLGRVMSGVGGNVILEEANRIMMNEYPEIAQDIKIHLPDEKSRRVGQSVAAAFLP